MSRFPVKLSLDASALRLMAFMEENRTDQRFRFPFSYSYPRNCCEGVSLIFRYLAFEKYGFDIAVWRGRKRSGEMHFWNVTTGGLIYDLTCSQFAKTKPVIGCFSSATSNRFRAEIIPIYAEGHVERADVVSAYRSGIIPF